MAGRRLLGWVVLVVGGILLLWGSLWGRAGYYESQAPMLFLLVFGGVALAGSGVLLLRKPKQPATPVSWRESDDREND